MWVKAASAWHTVVVSLYSMELDRVAPLQVKVECALQSSFDSALFQLDLLLTEETGLFD